MKPTGNLFIPSSDHQSVYGIFGSINNTANLNLHATMVDWILQYIFWYVYNGGIKGYILNPNEQIFTISFKNFQTALNQVEVVDAFFRFQFRPCIFKLSARKNVRI